MDVHSPSPSLPTDTERRLTNIPAHNSHNNDIPVDTVITITTYLYTIVTILTVVVTTTL